MFTAPLPAPETVPGIQWVLNICLRTQLCPLENPALRREGGFGRVGWSRGQLEERVEGVTATSHRDAHLRRPPHRVRGIGVSCGFYFLHHFPCLPLLDTQLTVTEFLLYASFWARPRPCLGALTGQDLSPHMCPRAASPLRPPTALSGLHQLHFLHASFQSRGHRDPTGGTLPRHCWHKSKDFPEHSNSRKSPLSFHSQKATSSFFSNV